MLVAALDEAKVDGPNNVLIGDARKDAKRVRMLLSGFIDPPPPRSPFYDALPSFFRTGEATSLALDGGHTIDRSGQWTNRCLKRFQASGWIVRIRTGHYRKVYR